MILRYVRQTPFTPYPWLYFIRHDAGGVRTGTMGVEPFAELKASLERDGQLCPITVEWMKKPYPDGKGERRHHVLAVNVGNNRAEAMFQLGWTKADILFVVPDECEWRIPKEGRNIPTDSSMVSALRELWREVPRAHGDGLIGYADAWSESPALLKLAQDLAPNGPNSLRIERIRK